MPLREAMPASEMKPTMLATVNDWPVITSAATAPIAAIGSAANTWKLKLNEWKSV